MAICDRVPVFSLVQRKFNQLTENLATVAFHRSALHGSATRNTVVHRQHLEALAMHGSLDFCYASFWANPDLRIKTVLFPVLLYSPCWNRKMSS